ncbi:hypothetical protein K438DRAFT_1771304 [Mycena galopus ATCC 62051]|nr:hypothetical protein K438DRAFT_1771304 [Mycena galopus ATCC 62051]
MNKHKAKSDALRGGLDRGVSRLQDVISQAHAKSGDGRVGGGTCRFESAAARRFPSLTRRSDGICGKKGGINSQVNPSEVYHATRGELNKSSEAADEFKYVCVWMYQPCNGGRRDLRDADSKRIDTFSPRGRCRCRLNQAFRLEGAGALQSADRVYETRQASMPSTRWRLSLGMDLACRRRSGKYWIYLCEIKEG